MKKFLNVIVVGAIGTFVGYWTIFGFMVYLSPLTYAEMDFDHNGKIEFFEVDYASSFGEKKFIRDGHKCKEFFALKDGLPLKIVCQN